jgi:hypothetical protein
VRIVLVMALALALPLRAAGAVSAAFCTEARQARDGAGAPHAHRAHDPAAHAHGEPAGAHDCGFCAKHCSSASIALAADMRRPAPAAASEPPRSGARPFSGFVPDRLERPPLVL